MEGSLMEEEHMSDRNPFPGTNTFQVIEHFRNYKIPMHTMTGLIRLNKFRGFWATCSPTLLKLCRPLRTFLFLITALVKYNIGKV